MLGEVEKRDRKYTHQRDNSTKDILNDPDSTPFAMLKKQKMTKIQDSEVDLD